MRWTPAHTATATVMLEWIAFVILLLPCLLAYAGLLFFFRICDWVNRTWQRRAEIATKEKSMRNLLLVCLALFLFCGCGAPNENEEIRYLESSAVGEGSTIRAEVVKIGEPLKQTGLIPIIVRSERGYTRVLTSENLSIGQKIQITNIYHRNSRTSEERYFVVVPTKKSVLPTE